ncbi:MAG: PKD domain-containing protein [Thermoplasmata archaeon]|nr:MAG: PKD domain-containing protein [Thermoplasmata archaeon]
MIDIDESRGESRGGKWLVVIGIIVLLVVAFFGVHLVTDEDEIPEEDLKAAPYTSLRYVREGKTINFTAAKSTGDIASYFWEFGDGTSSDQMNPSHLYDTAGWYKVTLTVEDRKGNSDNESIIIGVQPVSSRIYEIEDELINTGSEPMLGKRFELRVGPNIEQPKVEIIVNIYNPVGRFTINITLKTWDDHNTITYEQLDTYSYERYKGDEIFFCLVIPREAVPQKAQNCYSTIETSVFIDQGRWYSANFQMSTIFFIERLNPPDL